MGQESENLSAVTSDSVSHEVAIEMSPKVRRSHLKVQLGKELRPHQVALGTCSPLRAGGPRTSLPCPYGSLLHRVWPLRPWGSPRDGSHSLCNLMTEEMFHLHRHTTRPLLQGEGPHTAMSHITDCLPCICLTFKKPSECFHVTVTFPLATDERVSSNPCPLLARLSFCLEPF